MVSFPLFLIIVFFSFLSTWCLRAYAIRENVVDVPNERSSHSIPTPRGGGVSIVVCFLSMAAFLYISQQSSILVGLLLAGSITALVGFLDDHGHIAARWRLIAHFLAAIVFILTLPNLPVLSVLDYEVSSALLITPLATLFIVWMLNLYNFMDGIDGIASIEAITCCFGVSILYYLTDNEAMSILPLTLSASVIGFLLWNFPPAKIFMGDAGSGFLGFTLAALALIGATLNPQFLWSWIILLGVFITDATFTLLRRLFRGEKVYEAHRSHAYQYAARRLGAHRPVTLGVFVINTFWLLPIAILVGLEKLPNLLGVVIAFLPLVLLAAFFNAGKKES